MVTEGNKSRESLFLSLTIVSGISLCVFSTCLWCCWSSLKVAINVIDASADFIMRAKRIVFVPIVYFFVAALITVLWAVCYANVVSLNEITPGTSP